MKTLLFLLLLVTPAYATNVPYLCGDATHAAGCQLMPWGGIDWADPSSPTHCLPGFAVTGIIGGAFDCLPASGGAADCTASALVCRAGRTGTTNDFTVSSDADGTISGSADPASGLVLRSSTAYPPTIKVGHTFTDQESLAIGSPLLSGVWPFSVTGDSALGQSSTLGFILLNGGISASPIIFGIGARGAIAAFTPSQHGDNLLKITGAGVDLAGNLTFAPAAADIVYAQDGDPGATWVPGQIVMITTNAAGASINRFWVRATGNIGVGNDFGVPEGRFHVRNEDAATVGTVFQGAPSQSADITQWKGRISTTLAASGHVGDATITLTDSSAFPPSGVVNLDRGDAAIGTDLVVAYTANNVGTGVLTLAAVLPAYLGSMPAGKLVYQSTTLATVDKDGGATLPNIHFTGAIPTCGAGCASLSAVSNDRAMDITVSAGVVTAVTVNFSATLSSAPICVGSTNTASVGGAAVTARSTTAVTFGTPSSIGSGHIYAHCFEIS